MPFRQPAGDLARPIIPGGQEFESTTFWQGHIGAIVLARLVQTSVPRIVHSSQTWNGLICHSHHGILR
jgi:hypothetical protein